MAELSETKDIILIVEWFSSFPEFDEAVTADQLAEVDAAIEEVITFAERLKTELHPAGKAIKPGDYDRLLDLLVDLEMSFIHIEEHCQEAIAALREISKPVASKAEGTDSP